MFRRGDYAQVLRGVVVLVVIDMMNVIPLRDRADFVLIHGNVEPLVRLRVQVISRVLVPAIFQPIVDGEVAALRIFDHFLSPPISTISSPGFKSLAFFQPRAVKIR